jgi:hypothetical protein
MLRLEKRGYYRVNENGMGFPEIIQTRLACSFPIIIKGFNIMGERYEELALVENISQRGLCFKTGQPLTPGSILTVYKTEDELEPVAIFEVSWISQCDERARKAGAQLLGDNSTWIKYLIQDVVLLEAAIKIRGTRTESH